MQTRTPTGDLGEEQEAHLSKNSLCHTGWLDRMHKAGRKISTGTLCSKATKHFWVSNSKYLYIFFVQLGSGVLGGNGQRANILNHL